MRIAFLLLHDFEIRPTPSNPRKAATIVDKILEDENRLEEAGSRERTFVLKSCSWTSVIRKLTRLYESVLSK